MQRGDLIELVIERMVSGGDGLARHEGRVVFVPYVLPGERVRVRLTRVKRQWARGRVVALLKASTERVAPRCAHFGPGGCGGCQWQHASYTAQLGYKTEIVREQFQRIAKIETPPVRPTIGMEVPWHYRNTVQLRPTPQGPGFVRADHRGVLPLRECHLLNETVHELFEQARGAALPGAEQITLRGGERTGEPLVLMTGRAARPLPFDPGVPVVWHDEEQADTLTELRWHETVGGQRWQIGAAAFFQVNSRQAERLLAVVRGLMRPLPSGTRLLDLYAGVGLFGLSFVEEVDQLFLVESDPAALVAARDHARPHPNTTVIAGRSEEVIAAWDQIAPPPDVVMLDPPRAGCDPTLIESLGKHPISTIIYVSCDPATQARDVHLLLAQGYDLDVVQPVDMFPQTYHIESVARLRRLENTVGGDTPRDEDR